MNWSHGWFSSAGHYQNASEVLREGLRLIEHRETEDTARLAALQAAARIGIADIDAGCYRRFDSADEFAGHLSSLANKALDAV